MKKTDIKRIVIIILAITNFFLLIIVISNAIDAEQSRRARIEALSNVLASRSITLSDGLVLVDPKPAEITLVRNLKKEKGMLTSLIGNTTVTDLGGNIYLYEGISGSASFRGTGDFSLAFNTNSISIGSDPVKTSVTVLGKMGIECSSVDARVGGSDASPDVTLNCAYKGEPVFNMRVTCFFNNGSLSVIEGRRPLDDVDSRSAPDDYPDIASIIMVFLNYLDANGEVCTSIETIKIGYFAKSKDVSSYSLLPVWQITTDVGTYFFNAHTGDALALE